jgi:hypothetical protein
MKRRLAFLPLALAASCAAAQPRTPVPDPRLEAALSATLIKESERSVQPHRTLPRIAMRPPRVEEPDMARMGEGVYVERRLLPPRGPHDPEAVHVRRGDR